MSDQPYNKGGVLPAGPVRVFLHPDECVLEPERLRCVRSDHNHRDCQRDASMTGGSSGE